MNWSSKEYFPPKQASKHSEQRTEYNEMPRLEVHHRIENNPDRYGAKAA